LLAEDNVINQQVAMGMLQRAGHNVTVANNGLEVLRLLAEDSYDVILMDVQMPEMDGLQAATAIRENERGTGRHVPIIAMTAYAMKGDRERCLDAGMDDYVSKPVHAKELAQVLARVMGAMTQSHPEAMVQPPAAPSPAGSAPPVSTVSGDGQGANGGVIDWEAALDLLEGRNDSLITLVKLFREQCPKITQEIHQALDAGDAAHLQRAAHSLKGSAAVFHAQPTVDAASQLERLGREGDLKSAPEVLHTLDDRIGPLLSELDHYLQDHPD
jgi:CheY-like chemotaxis protein/HPt (histidine-containing phosphotransfer) domain-containing protein